MTLPPMPPLPEPSDSYSAPYYTAESMQAYAEQYGRLCAEAEREACAELADAKAKKVNSSWIANDIARDIRARSQR